MKGFTIVEIMIAMGVLSVVMLGAVQLAVNDSKSSKKQNLDFDFTIMAGVAPYLTIHPIAQPKAT